MNRTMRISVFIFTVTFVLLPFVFDSSAYAACTPDVRDGDSIQDAINAITSTPAEICIGVGTYEEDIVLEPGITLRGEELARTIIDGGGSGAVVTAASNTTIINLTVKNGSTGILFDSTSEPVLISGVVVKNVIITDTTTAIDCTACDITIDHTVIDRNTTGIDMAELLGTLPVVTLQNSMLTNNVTDVRSDQTPVSFDTASHNLLFNNTNKNYPTTDSTSKFDKDPLFVDRASNDYHLMQETPPSPDSPIDAGTGTDPDGSVADIGAYGGTDMDTRPFPVENIRAEKVNDTTIDVFWNRNEAYNIDGYKVHYGRSSGAYETSADVNDPTLDTLRLTGLQGNPTGVKPTGVSTTPGDGKLRVSWNAVTGASGYRVNYGISGGATTTLNVGNTTSVIISGLTNYADYDITVSALFKTDYFVSVSAFVTINSQNIESKLVDEASVTLQDESEGPASEVAHGRPEEVVPFPPLKDENRCFIATAAFGSPLEPHVKVLRTFRDRYLLTNGAGRQLVSSYYAISPPIADFIWSHEWLRAVARTALFPLVWAVSFYMQPFGPVLSVLIFLILTALALHLFKGRRLS